MVVPILLTLAFLGASLHNLNWNFQANVPLVISVTTLAKIPSFIADPSPAAIELYFSLVLSFFSLSLAENALVTGLLIFKILTVYRDIRELERRIGYTNGLGREVVRIMTILLESGVITIMAQLVQTVMFKLDNTSYPIIGGPVIQIYVRVLQSIVDLKVFCLYIYPIMQGISMAIVLLRVEMGLAYEVDNIASNIRFTASTASNHDSDTTVTVTSESLAP